MSLIFLHSLIPSIVGQKPHHGAQGTEFGSVISVPVALKLSLPSTAWVTKGFCSLGSKTFISLVTKTLLMPDYKGRAVLPSSRQFSHQYSTDMYQQTFKQGYDLS